MFLLVPDFVRDSIDSIDNMDSIDNIDSIDNVFLLDRCECSVW